MNICLIGNGLTNLIIAKILVKKKINVDLFYRKKILSNPTVRTIGISKENMKFIKESILNVEKISWPIKEIKIFNEINKSEEVINFSSTDKKIFSIVKNHEFYNLIIKSLKKEKYFSKNVINRNSSFFSVANNEKYDFSK